MRWTVTTPPAMPVIDWPRMKAHLRLVDDRQKPLVDDYVAQATAHAEQMMQCSLISRTITATYDETDDEIVLARGPVLSITSVVDGVGQPVTGYRVRYVGHRVTLDVPHRYAMPSPLTVTYVAGYAVVPADIAGMIRIHAATLYAWREDRSPTSANDVYKLDEAYRARSRGAPIA